MITKYVAIKGLKPYSIDIKDVSLLFDVYDSYIQSFGDYFIGLFDTLKLAEDSLEIDYLLFGDSQLSTDLQTILHLENCYRIQVETDIWE